MPPAASTLPAAASRLRGKLDRYGVAIATLLLLLLLAWLLAKWTWLVLQPREVTAPAVAAVVNADAARDSIINAHLFGAAGERKSPETAQVTSLNLKLKGVFAYSQDTPAYAIVNTGGKNDDPFRIGDEIQPGVILDSVYPTYILIERAGVLERVNLEERPGGTGGATTRPSAPRTQFNLKAPSPSPGNFNLSRSELQNSLQDPRQLTNLGRVNANPGGGVLVEEVPPGSLAERLGLQPGDVIRNINGSAINTPTDLGRLYQQIGQAAQVRVEGTRGSRPLNLTYNVQQ